MSRNQKLAPLLTGHTIAAVEPPTPAPTAAPASPFAPSPAATWHVRFTDGSVLAVRTDGTPPPGADRAHDAPVTDVTQRGTTFTLVLGPGAAIAALVFQTAEASGCVLLRDGAGKMAYAD